MIPAPVALGGGLPNVPNPTGVRGLHHPLYDVLGNGAWVFSFIFLLLAVVSVVLRYRRSAGEERLQLKWFAYAAAVSLGLIFALLPVAPMGTAGQVIYDMAIVGGIGLALPAALGVAVLKYRLYAIDRIISRTVSYVLVTGLVVGVYLGCVAVLTRVLPVRGSIGVAVSVLVAAALFNPLRLRVQARSTGGSTGPGTTPSEWSRSSRSSCATRLTSMSSAPTCSAWCRCTSWQRRAATCRCGTAVNLPPFGLEGF